jgi:hypothetical protein
MTRRAFDHLSKRQKRLARHAVTDTSLRRAEREPSKQELRDIAAEAFRNTAKMEQRA